MNCVNHTYIVLFTFLGISYSLTGCSNTEDILSNPIFEGKFIDFSASTNDILDSRNNKNSPKENTSANTINNTKFQEEGKFYVYSMYDDNSSEEPSSYPLLTKELIYKKDGIWTYDNKQKWYSKGIYHFRAVYPTNADIISSSNGKTLAIYYSIHAFNYDLLVAYHKRDMDAISDESNARRVKLCFNHALAGIQIKIKSAHPGYHLTDCHIKNVYTVGDFIYTDTNDSDKNMNLTIEHEGNKHTESRLKRQWKLPNMKTMEAYEWEAGESIFEITKDPKKIIDFTFAIPQDIDPTSEHRPQIVFTIEFEGNKVTTIKDLPKGIWDCGKISKYLIDISPSNQTNIEVTTTDWEEIDTTSDDMFFE